MKTKFFLRKNLSQIEPSLEESCKFLFLRVLVMQTSCTILAQASRKQDFLNMVWCFCPGISKVLK